MPYSDSTMRFFRNIAYACWFTQIIVSVGVALVWIVTSRPTREQIGSMAMLVLFLCAVGGLFNLGIYQVRKAINNDLMRDPEQETHKGEQ